MIKLLLEASALAQTRRTGVGYFTTYLADGLSKYAGGQKVDVDYFWLNFLKRKTPADGSLLQKAAQTGHLRQVSWIPQRLYAKLIFGGLRLPLLFKPTYDFVFFPNFYTWNVPAGKKSVVVIHDMCFARYPEFVEEKNLHFLRRVVASSVKRADLIVTISEFSKQEIIDYYHVDPAKILTLNIPVDATRFALPAGDPKQRLKERYGITKDYILFLSTLEPRKNVPVLIESYVNLPKELRDKYSLVLAGGYGWKTEELKQLIADKQAEGFDIITTGYFDHQDSGVIFNGATVFALPSHYEGFGMPPLEAMHMGVPVLANDIPVLREVGEGCSVFADASSAKTYGPALENLLRDDKLRADLSKKAKAKADTYSWDKTITKLAKKLEELSA